MSTTTIKPLACDAWLAMILLLSVMLSAGCGAAIDEADGVAESAPTTYDASFLIDGAAVDLQYELVDDLMVFEEDIVLDTDSEIPHDAQHPGALLSVKRTGELWPKGRIPYKIHSSVTTPGRVKQAMKEWEDKTNVRFVPRNGEAAFVVFKEEPGNTVCRANIGYNGGRRIVYLRDTSIRSSCNLGVIVHEIGHILGLWHEHTREDRDDYVRIIWANVGSVSAFAKKTTGVRKVGPYDINSTMHYRSFSYSRPTNKASIVKKDGSLLLHDWATLSGKDINSMALLYPARTESDETAEPPSEGEPVPEPPAEEPQYRLVELEPQLIDAALLDPWQEDPELQRPDEAIEEAAPSPELNAPSYDGKGPEVIAATGGCSTVRPPSPAGLAWIAALLAFLVMFRQPGRLRVPFG